MNSNLKYGLPLLLLLVVIFGVTLITQYTGTSVDPDGNGANTVNVTNEPPLFLKNTKLMFDPLSEDLSLKYFPGFYEIKDEPVPVSFWFQNRTLEPVQLAVLHRSCTNCTTARIMTFPEAEWNSFVVQSALGSIPAGAMSPPSFFSPLALTALMRTTPWKTFAFDTPDNLVNTPPLEIPAAKSASTPTWGIFQMGIKITGLGPKMIAVDTIATVGTRPPFPYRFEAGMIGVNPFDVAPKSISLGDFPEGAAPRVTDIFVWSLTRSAEELPPPVVTIPSDPFLRTEPPVPLTTAELAKLTREQSVEGRFVRIQCGYRIRVTMVRKLTDAAGVSTEPDIGPFSKMIGISTPGSPLTAGLPISGTVSGLVALTDGTKIDLMSFDGKYGTEKTVGLVSDRTDFTLEVLEDEVFPKYLKVVLSENPREGGRRTWTLKVHVPAGTTAGDLPPETAVVLRAKLPMGSQKVRIPVKGRGRT